MTIKGTIKASQLKLKARLSYYTILSLHRGSTQDEVEAAWKKLSREMHPDAHHAKQSTEDRVLQTEAFAKLGEAYAVLKDRKLRRLYERLVEVTGDVCSDCKGSGRMVKLSGRPSMRELMVNPGQPLNSESIPCARCLATGRIKRLGTQAPELMQTGGK